MNPSDPTKTQQVRAFNQNKQTNANAVKTATQRTPQRTWQDGVEDPSGIGINKKIYSVRFPALAPSNDANFINPTTFTDGNIPIVRLFRAQTNIKVRKVIINVSFLQTIVSLNLINVAELNAGFRYVSKPHENTIPVPIHPVTDVATISATTLSTRTFFYAEFDVNFDDVVIASSNTLLSASYAVITFLGD